MSLRTRLIAGLLALGGVAPAAPPFLSRPTRAPKRLRAAAGYSPNLAWQDRDGRRDVVRCGACRGDIVIADRRDTLHDCERVERV